MADKRLVELLAILERLSPKSRQILLEQARRQYALQQRKTAKKRK